MADRLPFSGEQYWNAISRNAFPGARLYTYTSLSRTTLKATFTDAGAGTPHSNPVIADANGLFDAIYGTGAYFIDIYNTDDTTLIYQEDEVFGSAPANVNQTVTVSLIADLRLVDTTAFQSAFVEGTTVIDDGGQARFFFDSLSSAIDNGTTIIAPTVGTGRWLILNIETLALGDNSVTVEKLSWMPLTAIDGLSVTHAADAAHDLTIAAGSIANSTQTVILTGTQLTKQIDAPFAEGDDVGGFSDQDTLSTDEEYNIYIIGKADGTTDYIYATTQANALADTVATAASYINARRFKKLLTDASSNIQKMFDRGNNLIMLDTPTVALDANMSTVGAALTVALPADTLGVFHVGGGNASTTTQYAYYNAIDETNQTVSNLIRDVGITGNGAQLIQNSTTKNIQIDSSRQIRQRSSGGTVRGTVDSLGWIDNLENL